MIKHAIASIQGDINNTISILVQDMCKENKISYIKQDYKFLLSIDTLLLKNNEIKFTSGSKNTLSFYGKIYLNKNKKIIENIYLQDEVVSFEPKNTDILIISGGVNNSTFVETDEEVMHFYVAPSHLLELHKPNLWQTL